MSTDIYTHVEQQQEDGTWEHIQWSGDEDHGPFDDRSYWRFGWLAGVRDHDVTPITPPRGLPDDLSAVVRKQWGSGLVWHTPSWLTVQELVDFDYDQPAGVDDETYRDMLGPAFFDDVEQLTEWDQEQRCRVVFWFDS